jgi:hypothetical protein
MESTAERWPQGVRRRLALTFGAGVVIGAVLGVIAFIVLISMLTVMISLP